MCLETMKNKNSGDTDAVLPLTGTRYSIKALKLKTLVDWHAWYDKEKVYKHVTFLLISFEKT